MTRKWDVSFTPPFFMGYTIPQGGCLPDVPAAHGLWYYYLLARKAYEEWVEATPIQYDDSMIVTNTPNFRQLLESIAMLYGTKPQELIRYWDAVDKQAMLLGLPQLPDEERYRFNKPAIVTTLTNHKGM